MRAWHKSVSHRSPRKSRVFYAGAWMSDEGEFASRAQPARLIDANSSYRRARRVNPAYFTRGVDSEDVERARRRRWVCKKEGESRPINARSSDEWRAPLIHANKISS